MSDAVVIGAGPNGLVGANLLADAGWDVVVLEANDTPGGAVRTAEVTAPGFRNDLFSAFYPLAAASPAMRALRLEQYGLRWRRAPLVLANPTPSGPTVLLSTDLDETAASLDAFAPGDGDRWRTLFREWQGFGGAFIDAMFGAPFPPVRAGVRLLAGIGPRELLPFARLAVIPVRRLAEERFRGAGAALLLAGNALHADLTPGSNLSGLFGLALAGLGQEHGFPVPEGGAQSLTDALVRRLEARGGRVVCGSRVTGIEVRGRRAVAVRTEAGDEVGAARAVLADVAAPTLYLALVGPRHLPARVVDAIAGFEHGTATFKVDWALSSPIPWKDAAVARAGTVHLADSVDDLSASTFDLVLGRMPANPFLLLGQMTTADPTRSPAGTESAWAYTHVPHGLRWDDRDAAVMADRIEQRIEDHAPGFRDRILARHVLTPPGLEEADANLIGGDLNGGTAQLHQQLVFRPIPGLGRPETPIRGLYLASASAHPGGGVHGAPGANAARAALWHDRLRLSRR